MYQEFLEYVLPYGLVGLCPLSASAEAIVLAATDQAHRAVFIIQDDGAGRAVDAYTRALIHVIDNSCTVLRTREAILESILIDTVLRDECVDTRLRRVFIL